MVGKMIWRCGDYVYTKFQPSKKVEKTQQFMLKSHSNGQIDHVTNLKTKHT